MRSKRPAPFPTMRNSRSTREWKNSALRTRSCSHKHMEKMSRSIPDDPSRKKAAQNKLENLLNEITDLQGPSHHPIPAEIIDAAVDLKKRQIQELKKDHPELNN